MINISNQVPAVYTSASRDFQYLGWLFDIVLNSVKHNVDGMYDLPNTRADAKLSELLALTLGFKIKRNYDQRQLAALVSILPTILKYKGTIRAIELAASTIVTAAGAYGDVRIDIHGLEVVVNLPNDLVDISLFLDLLDYILPAGMTCRIVRKAEKIINLDKTVVEIGVGEPLYNMYEAINIEDGVIGTNSLSVLFDAAKTGALDVTSNFIDNNIDKLNAGLLTNSIIATMAEYTEHSTDNTLIKQLASTELDGSNRVLQDKSNEPLAVDVYEPPTIIS